MALDKLQSLEIHDIEVTDKEIGRGAYGVVYEIRVSGLVCAGKKLHDAIIQDSTLAKFAEECLCHSQQRHPNIVQLMGVYYPQGSRIPMLVMEYLPMSLTQCLETHKDLPIQFKCSILLDVARGLNYLHCKRPPIIHRDLTANNILLTTSFMAKISDLGVSRMADTFKQHQLTTAPGNAIVMPPEALTNTPRYDHKLDVFSYGCLILFVLTHQWPEPSAQFISKPNDPMSYIRVQEYERRSECIKLISKNEPLLPIAKECLCDDSSLRPTIDNIIQQLEKITASLFPLKNNLELIKEVEEIKLKSLKEVDKLKKETESQKVSNEKLLQKMKEEQNKLLLRMKVHQDDLNKAEIEKERVRSLLQFLENEQANLMLQIQQESFMKDEIVKLQNQLSSTKKEYDRIIDAFQNALETLLQKFHTSEYENDSTIKTLQMENERVASNFQCMLKLKDETIKYLQLQLLPSPDCAKQKEIIQSLMKQELKKDEKWYLVDYKWFKKWKGYTGYDDCSDVLGNPGPVDNANLFKDQTDDQLKEDLIEKTDYFLLPRLVFDKLVQWYGMSEGSRPICRYVIEHDGHLNIEVYLLDLKLCVYLHANEPKVVFFSRADTIKSIKEKFFQLYEIPTGTETRIWHHNKTHGYELLTNFDQTLSNADLYEGQFILLEKKDSNGVWPNRAGFCGLSNLGHTSFINSILQCLSNTQPLVEHFIGKGNNSKQSYKKLINKGNPNGMGGKMAEAFGGLLEDIWNGHYLSLAPRQFKLMMDIQAFQFDSFTFLTFVLENLHEDINLIRKKPDVDINIITEQRSDKDIAEETWRKYLQCNESVIVHLFQGQLKQIRYCPKCKKQSPTFDPFTYLSLPIPVQNFKNIFIYLIKSGSSSCLMKLRLFVPSNGIITDLKDAIHELTGIDSSRLVVTDVYHSRFHKIYNDDDSLSLIKGKDDIYVYELRIPLDDQEWIPVPVYMRETKKDEQMQVTTCGQVFGLPIVVAVPCNGCSYRTLYNTIMAQIDYYIDKPDCEKDEIMKDKELAEKMTEEEKKQLFELVLVDSYGNQEVLKLSKQEHLLKLTSQTYISCDWEKGMKDQCYNMQKADMYEEHESCTIATVEEEQAITIYDCMDLFVLQEELLEKSICCTNCNKFMQPSRKFELLWKMPEILVIHLKRFPSKWDAMIKERIEFPLEGLDLSKYVIDGEEAQYLYGLYAVSNCSGRHNTAYAKNKNNNNWYSFDDSYVFSIEPDANKICSSASYILFYKRGAPKETPVSDKEKSISASALISEEEMKGGQKTFFERMTLKRLKK